MRVTVEVDDDLLRTALEQTGARSKTEVVELGLRVLLEREARKRLRALYGKMPDVERTPRRN